MKVNIYKTPFTFVVIDDWLDEETNQLYLDEAVRLIPYMKESKVGHDKGSVVADFFKKSKNLWMFLHYMEHRNQRNLAVEFEQLLWSDEIKQVFHEANDGLFEAALTTNSSDLLLSKYENGDHYEWHRDYCHLLTVNYMLAKEPLQFEGGEFLIGSWDKQEVTHTVEFKNNRLIIFPSRSFHKVAPVQNLQGGSENARFTLQYWGQMKYRQET
jgi:Rps23 Pro-64 3,4-dihydroxylase Tpa1-like proline 4-hydroxylase